MWIDWYVQSNSDYTIAIFYEELLMVGIF